MARKSSKPVPPEPPRSAWFDDAFETYADATDGSIGPDGIEKLCEGLQVDPTDPLILVLAWQLGASQMGYFSREEWKSGAHVFGVASSLEELKQRLSSVYASTRQSPDRLRELHIFTHKFCR